MVKIIQVDKQVSEQGIIQALNERAGPGALLSFRDFMEVALYHPTHGYYRRDARRVGRTREADFYTAESIGPVFARLVLAAADSLLGGTLAAHTFVELGAEPGLSPFAQLAPEHCAGYRAVTPGDALALDGPCVVFGNEVLDAQPCHRLVFTGGRWRESGVQITPEGLTEALLPELSAPIQAAALPLPATMPEGYRLDLALDAEQLLQNILEQSWTGLLVLPDYGHFWQTLIEERPCGTTRAYYRHEQSNDLLARPGQQDLTAHVCWDRLEAVCLAHGLAPKVQRQESFFVLNAEQAIATIIQGKPDAFDPQRQSLMELLHPQHMGAKFQALHAVR